MKKAAWLLVLALPALLMADINRLNPFPDLVADDTRAWSLPRIEQMGPATSFGPPAGTVAFPAGNPQLGLTPTPCPASGPTRPAIYLSQPDCRSSSGWPMNWMIPVSPSEAATVRAESQAGRKQTDSAPAASSGKTEQAN